MAKYHYRLYGEGKWQSESGNALFAFSNVAGSGKKISINSIEITPITVYGGTNSAAFEMYRTNIVSASIPGGTEYKATKFDTNSPDLPEQIKLKTDNCYSGYTNIQYTGSIGTTISGTHMSGTISGNVDSTRVDPNLISGSAELYRVIPFNRQFSLTTLGAFTAPLNIGRDSFEAGNIVNNNKYGSEHPCGIILREGQALHFTPCNNALVGMSSIPLYIDIKIIVGNSLDSGNSYYYSFYSNVVSRNTSIFTLYNDFGSGQIVRVKSISISEMGTTDSPYFQIVPIGAIDSNTVTDTYATCSTVMKFDTNSPDINPQQLKIYLDTPILPYGVPTSYIADASTATPKGLNYLHTKDYIGPIWGTFFPEANANIFNGIPGLLGAEQTKQFSRIKSFIDNNLQPITIREGEGIAITAASETAVGVTAGVSAYSSFNFGIDFYIENATTPYLILNNVANNSEIKILSSGTTTVLTGIENVINNTFSWPYDYSPNTYVDIVIHHLDYDYIKLTNILLTQDGISIPIQQNKDIWTKY